MAQKYDEPEYKRYMKGDLKRKDGEGYNFTFTHSKKCFACGKNRTRSNLVYFLGDMKSYCRELDECENRKEHPEFLKKMYDTPEYRARLIPAVHLKELIKEMDKLYSQNAKDSFFKLAGKSVAARFEPHQAMYIAKLAQKFQTETVQETMRVIIDMVMSDDKYGVSKTDLLKTRLVKDDK